MVQRVIAVRQGEDRRHVGTGWLPDLPDIRDRTVKTAELVAPLAKQVGRNRQEEGIKPGRRAGERRFA